MATRSNGSGWKIVVVLLGVVVTLATLGWRSLDIRVHAVEQRDRGYAETLGRIDERLKNIEGDISDIKEQHP